MNQDVQFIEKLTRIVTDNLDNEQFGVEQFSCLAGLSRSQLHRKIRKLSGQSTSAFIRNIRLEEALKLLKEDAGTASEIAYRVGFNSASYFHKCFHDRYGYSPGDAKKLIASQGMDPISPKDPYPNKSQDVYQTFRIRRLLKSFFLLFRPKYVLIGLAIFTLTGMALRYFSNGNAPITTSEKSIAVLPFTNLSTDKSNQHFADGLVDDLLNRLSMVGDFKVISRTSSDTYRERGQNTVKEIAEALGVIYVLEGSVRKYGNKARISVQLIDAIHDDHIWSRSFDRDMKDLFRIQSDIAVKIASGLQVALTEQQTRDLKKEYTTNPRAFEFYQLGRFYWGKRIPKDYEIAIRYFNLAIEEDPEYALAYAGLGDTYFLKIWSAADSSEIRENRNLSELYALKALSIDDRLTEAITVLATIYSFIDWNWSLAEGTYMKALSINSNYSTLHHRYSEHLSFTGRHAEARKHINKAIELDPLSYVIRRVSTKLYMNQGNFHEALAEVKLSEDINPESKVPYWYEAMIHYSLQDDEALAASLKNYLATPDPESIRTIDSIHNSEGGKGLMRWAISNIKPLVTKAQMYAFMGENDNAIDLLELAYKKGLRLQVMSYWYSPNNLYSNPRYVALMRKMHLPWKPEPME